MRVAIPLRQDLVREANPHLPACSRSIAAALSAAPVLRSLLSVQRSTIPADNHLPQFENWEVEMADLLIRVFDICGAYQVDLSKVFAAKREYNANREDHKREARLQANGKKY